MDSCVCFVCVEGDFLAVSVAAEGVGGLPSCVLGTSLGHSVVSETPVTLNEWGLKMVLSQVRGRYNRGPACNRVVTCQLAIWLDPIGAAMLFSSPCFVICDVIEMAGFFC